MLRTGAAVRLALRFSALSLAALLVVSAFATSADARARRHYVRHRAAAVERYQPSFASIVVDANTGAVLQSTNADSPRHPASLTKIMTLYLLFERLEAGKLKLSSELSVSPHASAQAPSKLGLQPGQTINVETAIKAIVTKSANDVAVVVAEALGGTEEDFAKQMTAKARALGMTRTAYYNASGLPEDRQITTARDVALLGRAIQERFPGYYHYFSLRTFEYHGKPIRNHNHLLGAVAGVDGIKTGYIHDSGFNITINLRRGGRHMIVVVFGGRTANVRDARVRNLIDENIARASPKRTEPVVAEKGEPREQPHKTAHVASAAPSAPEPGSTAPIKPTPVKTFTVKAGSVKTASLSAVPLPSQKLTATPANVTTASITTVATVKREPPALPPPPGAKPGVLGVLSVKVASASDSETGSTTVAAKSHNGWMIQVGAFDDEVEAKQRLTIAQQKAETQLGRAEPFTERVAKGDKALFRARFAGLEKDQAEAACKHLKRSDIPCMTLRN